MKKLFTLAFALASTIGFAASAQSLGTGEIVSGVEDGASYTTYQSEVVVTWGEDNIQFVSDDPRFNLYFYDYAYPEWPDNWGVGGNAEIVSVNGGTKNAVRFTFDSYTSQLDPSDYFGPRLTKYGEFTLTIPEGFVKSPSGAENDVQEIFWKQVETIESDSLGIGEIVSGVEDGASYTTYQSEVVVTWGEDNIQFVSDDPRFNLYFYDYAYPQWPDNWGVGGNVEIVSVNGGTKNAVRFTFDSYTSQLDPSDYFGPRLTKYGEFTLTIPEGFVISPNGAENDVQEIFWKQVETISSEDPEPIVTGEIDNLTSTEVTVTFTPNQDVAGYYVCLFEPSVEAYFEMIGSMFGFLDPTEMIITFAWYEQNGVYTESWDELTPETDYEIGIAVRGLDGLYVPYQSVAFTTPSDSSTAVNGINSDSEAVYYDLNGKRIMNPEKGMMLIKVQNGKTTKVIK